MRAREFSAADIAAGRRFDAELRARAQEPREVDEYASGDRVCIPGGEWGAVLGTAPYTAHEERAGLSRSFIIELDRELPHGRRVVAYRAPDLLPERPGAAAGEFGAGGNGAEA